MVSVLSWLEFRGIYHCLLKILGEEQRILEGRAAKNGYREDSHGFAGWLGSKNESITVNRWLETGE